MDSFLRFNPHLFFLYWSIDSAWGTGWDAAQDAFVFSGTASRRAAVSLGSRDNLDYGWFWDP